MLIPTNIIIFHHSRFLRPSSLQPRSMRLRPFSCNFAPILLPRHKPPAAGLRQKRPGSLLDSRASRSTAATYSPNWWVSTIGDGELNFSVRNGKRWFLTAIATAVYDLRERSRDCQPARPCAPIDTLRRKSLSRTYSLLQFHLRRIFP